MGDPRDRVPGYRTIRVAALDASAAEADRQAWQARERYPDLGFAGPVFGVAAEREYGGWEILVAPTALAPQDARDEMGSVFRRAAQQAERSGDQAAYAECMAAAELMDREAIDEQTVLGTRYRVIRIERFARLGPDGPEPPRPTDTATAGTGAASPARPGRRRRDQDRALGMVIDPLTPTGMAGSIVTIELLDSFYPQVMVPADVWADSARAGQTHPGGVLLPPAFAVGEAAGGRWHRLDDGVAPTPQASRENLVGYLRVTAPWHLNLSPADRATYAAAAEQLEDHGGDEVRVAGRWFRIARLERLARIGPDGPEGPRPSDPDPQPPIEAQTGGYQPADDDQETPTEPDDDNTKRFLQLFHEEQARLKARNPPPEPS